MEKKYFSNKLEKRKISIVISIEIIIVLLSSIAIFIISDIFETIMTAIFLIFLFLLTINLIINAPIIIKTDIIIIPKKSIIWYTKQISIEATQIIKIYQHKDWYYIELLNGKEYSIRKNKFFSNNALHKEIVLFAKRNSISFH